MGKKIYESPDGGKTVFERDLGSRWHDNTDCLTIDGITYNEREHRRHIKKKLPIDILAKLDPELVKE